MWMRYRKYIYLEVRHRDASLTRDKLIAAQHALYARELTRICTNDRLIQIFVDKSASLRYMRNENYIDSMIIMGKESVELLRTKILQALTIRRTLSSWDKNGRHMVSAGFSGHQEFTDLAVSINSEIVISLRSFSWCFGNLGFCILYKYSPYSPTVFPLLSCPFHTAV